MTALNRAIGWFIAPPEPESPVSPRHAFAAPAVAAPLAPAARAGTPTLAPPSARESPAGPPAFVAPLAPAARVESHPQAAPPAGESPVGATAFAAPSGAVARVETPVVVAPVAGESLGGASAAPRGEAHAFVAPLAGAAPGGAAAFGASPLSAGSPLVGGPAVAVSSAVESGRAVTAVSLVSAGVLGRPREVEPVAAALALALRRDTRAKVATVVLIGGGPVEGSGGGGAAARRMVARLEACGLEPRVRGRLVWVRLEPGDPQLLAWIRRVMYVGAPAVLAVAAPRSAATDEALAEQDLLVLVTGEPEGPLARSATAGLAGVPIVTVPPLTRGPARALACAGVRTTGGLRRLVRAGGEGPR